MERRDLGTVECRWLDGGRLELRNGDIYGPCAIFRVSPVPILPPLPAAEPGMIIRVQGRVHKIVAMGRTDFGDKLEMTYILTGGRYLTQNFWTREHVEILPDGEIPYADEDIPF